MAKIKRTEILHDIIVHVIHSLNHIITIITHWIMYIFDWSIVKLHHLPTSTTKTLCTAITIVLSDLPIIILMLLSATSSFIWC